MKIDVESSTGLQKDVKLKDVLENGRWGRITRVLVQGQDPLVVVDLRDALLVQCEIRTDDSRGSVTAKQTHELVKTWKRYSLWPAHLSVVLLLLFLGLFLTNYLRERDERDARRAEYEREIGEYEQKQAEYNAWRDSEIARLGREFVENREAEERALQSSEALPLRIVKPSPNVYITLVVLALLFLILVFLARAFRLGELALNVVGLLKYEYSRIYPAARFDFPSCSGVYYDKAVLKSVGYVVPLAPHVAELWRQISTRTS